MANISIRNLDDSIKEALRLRAAAEHCSMEEFLRRCLAEAAVGGGNPATMVPESNKAAVEEGQAIGGQSGEAGAVIAGVFNAAANAGSPDFTAEAAQAIGQGVAAPAAEPQFIAGQAAATKPQFSALRGKNIVLIIGGSIAAYKALELIRLLRRAGAVVRVIMTAAAQQFITPLLVGALAGGPVYRHLFAREDEQYIVPGLDGGGCQQENMPSLGGCGREGEDLGDFERKPISGLSSENWPEQIAAGQGRENRPEAAGCGNERETEGARNEQTEGVWAGQTKGARANVQTMSGSRAGLDRLACGGAPPMAVMGGGQEQVREIGHIQLARQADIVLICAATASRLAKMAAGQADDLAGAVLLATRAPILLAPAMNPAMWAHKATQRNLALLRRDGCHIIGPERGEMAESGEAGLGRMSEPAAIQAALAALAAALPGLSSGGGKQESRAGLAGCGLGQTNAAGSAVALAGNAPHMGVADDGREQGNLSGLGDGDLSRSIFDGRTNAPGLGGSGHEQENRPVWDGFERRQTGIAGGEADLANHARPAEKSDAARLGEGAAFKPDFGAPVPGGMSGARVARPAGSENFAAALSHMAVPDAASLAGRHIIITSGPTHEALDPVRYLANRSSGKQGHALAAALAACGTRVTLVCGPVLLPDPPGVEAVHVTSARQMRAAVLSALPADAAIFVAAVADWRPQYVFSDKIKKPKIRVIVAGSGKNKTEAAEAQAVAALAGSGVEIGAGQVKLTLVENPDILAEIGHNAQRPRLVVGFAAETKDLLANAAVKLEKKGADWIIANNVATAADGSSIMGGDRNHIHILSRFGVEEWPEMSKIQVAVKLAEKIAAFFAAAEQK